MPRIMKTDETKTTSTTHAGNITNTIFYVKPDATSKTAYMVECSYDFAGCTNEEIRTLACRSLNIETQRMFRDAINGDAASKKSALDDATWKRRNVKKLYVDVARRTADPVARVRNAFTKATANMSPAARAALLASLK